MDFEVRRTDPQVAGELGQELGLSSTVAQLLLHRGLSDVEQARRFLAPKLAHLSAPDAMADRVAAADRLAHAVRTGERIAIFGDYDVDGTTSAAVLAEILSALGGEVVVEIANRFDGGYGFSQEALARVLAHSPALVVTCDCGSSDHARLAQLAPKGIDAIVVDHHLVPDEPLPVLAFLNPNRPDCGFGFKGLCSAGLALSLGAGVRGSLDAPLDLRRFLDLVALGTIADVVPLAGDNRALTRAGLQLLSSPHPRPGIAVLRELAKVRPGTALGAIDVSYKLTPRLNAPGRLGDQGISLSLLRAGDMESARELGARIDELNEQRRGIEREVTSAALQQARDVYGASPTGGVVVGAEGWHRGVVGISAARLVDELGVPVVVVGFDGGEGHGSCRTPDGFRLYDALTQCAASLTRFGGHQAASGVSLPADRLDAFRADFASAIEQQAADAGPRPPVMVDVVVDGRDFPVPRASELAQLEPLGEANAQPLFHVPRATVAMRRVVGQGQDHLKLQLGLPGGKLSAFGFDLVGTPGDVPEGTDVQVLGSIRPDSWRGGEAVELHIEAIEPA